MMTTLPTTICIGRPLLTALNSGAGQEDNYFSGTEFSTAGRFEIRRSTTGEIVVHSQWSVNGQSGGASKIHDWRRWSYRTFFGGLTGQWFNPIGYNRETPSAIIQDLLRYRGQVGLAQIAKHPTDDVSTTNWTIAGEATAWEATADPVTDFPVDVNDHVFSQTNGATLKLSFSGSELPSTVTSIKEIIIRGRGETTETGTGQGHGLVVRVYRDHTEGVDNGTLIDSARSLWIPEIDKPPPHDQSYYFEQKIGGLNLTKANCDSLKLEVDFDFEPGATPVATMFVWSFQLDLVCEVNDVSSWESGSFDGADTYFSSSYSTPDYELDCDFYNMGLDEAIMEVLAHTPELVLFLNNNSEIALEVWPDYDDVSTPYVIGLETGQPTIEFPDNLLSIIRTFKHEDRWSTYRTIRWDTDRAFGLYPGDPDPDNRKAQEVLVAEQDKGLDRVRDNRTQDDRPHMFDQEILGYYNAATSQLFASQIDGIEIEMDKRILRLSNNEVVAFNFPGLGYNDKKHVVSSIEIDLDEMIGTVIILDRTFVQP